MLDCTEGTLKAPLLMNGGTTSGATGEALFSNDLYYNSGLQVLFAPAFNGNLNGTASVALKANTADSATKATTADSATKATQDGNGNNIVNTYATKTVATQAVNGLMSWVDKKKLDSYSDSRVIRTGQIDAAEDTWHICASISGTPCNFQDVWALFHIECGMDTYVKSGFLRAWLRFKDNAILYRYQLRWEGMPCGIHPDNFVMNIVQDTTTKVVTARIFIKSEPFEIWSVSIVNRGWRYDDGSLFNWELVGHISEEGQNALGQGRLVYSEFEDTASHMRIGPTDVFGSYGYADTPSDNYWPPVELFLRDKNTQNIARIQPVIMSDKNAAVLFVRQKDGNETAYRFESTTGQVIVSKPNIGDYTIAGANISENDFGGTPSTSHKWMIHKFSNGLMMIWGKINDTRSRGAKSTFTFPALFNSNSLPYLNISSTYSDVDTSLNITNTGFNYTKTQNGTQTIFYCAFGFY